MSYQSGDKYSIQGAYSLYCSICSKYNINQEPIEVFEDSEDILIYVEAILESNNEPVPQWIKDILND